MSMRKKVAIIVLLALLLVGGCAVYLGDYYHSNAEAIEAFTVENTVEMQEEDGNLIWIPEHADSGFIFYPGGKVEHTAYIPLMESLASRGILCVLVEMPFRLAVFDMDAAKGVWSRYPEVESWYIGGHSLGGSMAASYLAECEETFEGLVLLGSYSTADLSDTDLKVLSVYGSRDLVMNRENYEENRKNLPAESEEIVIDGGCHAYFGMYGAQEGDGVPEISNEEQIEITADAIVKMLKE